MTGPRPLVATVWLDDLPLEPQRWRITRRALCNWQATGRAHLVVGDQPVDIATLAVADGPDRLPRPDSDPGARVAVLVFDAPLAHQLVRLVRDANDGPPPDEPPTIGSQP